MEIINILLEDGVFVKVDSPQPIEEFSSKNIITDGWQLEITNEGTLLCTKSNWSFFRLFEIIYSIDKNGLEKLEKTRNGDVIKGVRKKNVLPEGQYLKDGRLTIYKRGDGECFISFKNKNYMKYRKENLLTEIAFINPNRTYTIRNSQSSQGFCRTILQTDGDVKIIDTNEKKGIKVEKVEVKNATWSVLEIDQEEYNEDGKHISRHPRELYTLQNPLKLDISQINK